MKIIKKGVLPSPAVYVGTCPNCKCEVECDEDEVKRNNDTTVYTFYVRCPTTKCGYRIILHNTTAYFL